MGLSKTNSNNSIFLSPPHMSGKEQMYVQEAFDTNWLAPVGPNVDAFEAEFCEYVGCEHAVALSSGTAALHMAMILGGIAPGDEVFVSTYTFSASVNPIVYQGAKPVFVDCELTSWNMDPQLLRHALEQRLRSGRLPKAVLLVHLYGQSADIEPIEEICHEHGILLIEDAAEAMGATYKGRHPGTFGEYGAFSFNGNKIITTTGGGMLVTKNEADQHRARKIATQARDQAPHYQHSMIGYNYRLSNVLAGIGRGQLTVLEDRVRARRRNFDYYQNALGGVPGIQFMPEANWGRHTRWHTCITVDPDEFGADREAIRLLLARNNIESRPTWKPMHMQPVFGHYQSIGGHNAEHLFERGLCLPSGSCLTESDLERICDLVLSIHKKTIIPELAY